MLGTTHSGLSGTTTSMCVRSRAVASNSFVNTENLTQNSSIDKRSALGLGVGGSPPLLPHGAFWNTGGDTLPRPGQCRLVRAGARTWQVMRPRVDNVACAVRSPLPLRGPWGRDRALRRKEVCTLLGSLLFSSSLSHVYICPRGERNQPSQ